MSENAAPAGTPLDTARGFAEARDWRGLAAWGAAAGDPETWEPEVAYLYADACRRTDDPATAARVLAALEPRVRAGGDRRLLLRTINLAGMIDFDAGRVLAAEGWFNRLLEAASDQGDDEFSARAANNLGIVSNLKGDRARALTLYTRALAAYQRIGLARGLAQTYHNLGISYRDLGFLSDADTSFRRAIDLGQSTGTEEVIAMAETERALLRARGGDPPLGAEMARRAYDRFERIGSSVGAAEALRVLAAAERAAGDDDAALGHLDQALGTANEHDDQLLKAEVQRDRGMLLRDRADRDGARAAFTEAAAAYDQTASLAEAAAIRTFLAEL